MYNTQSVLRGRDRLIVGLTASYGTIKVVKNVREYRRGNHELTIQRNWQYKLLKTKKNKNTTQHNTNVYVGNYYAETNTKMT